MGLADELGSGVRNMFTYNKVYSNAEPIIKEGDIFEITIPLVSKDEIKVIENTQLDIIINYIKENGRITSKETCNILNLERSRASQLLNIWVSENKIFRHGRSKNTYYDLISNE